MKGLTLKQLHEDVVKALNMGVDPDKVIVHCNQICQDFPGGDMTDHDFIPDNTTFDMTDNTFWINL